MTTLENKKTDSSNVLPMPEKIKKYWQQNILQRSNNLFNHLKHYTTNEDIYKTLQQIDRKTIIQALDGIVFSKNHSTKTPENVLACIHNIIKLLKNTRDLRYDLNYDYYVLEKELSPTTITNIDKDSPYSIYATILHAYDLINTK